MLSLNETLVILIPGISAIGILAGFIMLGFLLRQSRQAAIIHPQKSTGLYMPARLMVEGLSLDNILNQHTFESHALKPVTWTYIPPTELIPGPTVMPLYPQDSLLHADRLAAQNSTARQKSFADKLAG